MVVVLIAIPFGAVSGRRNVFMGVAGSIVICFAYFVVQQLALALGTGGYLAPWLAGWLPNLSFGLVGLCAYGAHPAKRSWTTRGLFRIKIRIWTCKDNRTNWPS